MQSMKWKIILLNIILPVLWSAVVLFPEGSLAFLPEDERHFVIFDPEEEGLTFFDRQAMDELFSHHGSVTIVTDPENLSLAEADILIRAASSDVREDSRLIDAFDEFTGEEFIIGGFPNENRNPARDALLMKKIQLPSGESLTYDHAGTFYESEAASVDDVLIQGERGDTAYPLLYKIDRSWYLETTPVDPLMLKALAAVMSDLLAVNPTDGVSAYTVISGVTPATSVDDLTTISNRVISRDIPAVISVSPVNRSPSGDLVSNRLSDNTELYRKLLALQEMGEVILYEYPDFEADTSEVLKRNTVENDLNEMAAYGLYPRGVSSIYEESVGVDDLNIMSDYFSMLFGQGNNRSSNVLMHHSWFVTSPTYMSGLTWFPVNLPANEIEPPLGPLRLERWLSETELIQDAAAGIELPVTISAEDAEFLLNEIEERLNPVWQPLHLLETEVETGTLRIETDLSGGLTVVREPGWWDAFLYRYQLTTLDIFLWSLAFVVSLFVTAFSLYTLYLRSQLRRSLFAERKSYG